MISSGHNSKKWFRLTLLVTAVIVLLVQLPLLLDAEYVHEDLRFFYWLFRFSNPALFEFDPLLGYQFAEVNLGFTTILFNKVSLLYGSLYALLSPFISPFTFSKILILPLAFISSAFLFKIAERITTPFAAFLLCALFSLIAAAPFSSTALSSGLPRVFTLPLLLAALYYMLVGNVTGMALVLVLGLFYPPVFLHILMAYGVKYAVETARLRRLPLTGKQLAVFASAAVVALLLLLPAILTGLNTVPAAADGSQAATVFSSPWFGDKGRYSLLAPNPLTANGGILDRGLIGLYSIVFGFILIPLALLLRGRFKHLPAPFWYLAAAGVIGFVLSWLAILFTPSATFHMPSRYMRGTIFLIGLLLVVINVPPALEAGSKTLAKNRGKLNIGLFAASATALVVVYSAGAPAALTAVITLLVLLIGVLVFIIGRRARPPLPSAAVPAFKARPNPAAELKTLHLQTVVVTAALILPFLFYIQGSDNFYRPHSETAELIDFIKTLPHDALISGYPCLLDDVPLYAQHTILFSCETESRDMALMTAALDAYFAESEAAVLSFCREYNVDYLVASPVTFTAEFRNRERIIYEPLNTILKEQLAGRTVFALEQIADDRKLFRNDFYYMVACSVEGLGPE